LTLRRSREGAPRLLRRVAVLVVRGPDAVVILGDLDECWVRDRAKGMSTARASFRYLRNVLGSAASLRRSRSRGTFGLAGAWLDVKLGLRMARKQPTLTVVAVFALAIGIPLGLVPFHLAQALTARLPFDEGDRIVQLSNRDLGTGQSEPTQLRDLLAWREGLTTFKALGAAHLESLNLVDADGRALPVRGSTITASAFDIVRVAPLMGRRLVQADERPGAADVIVLAYDLWQSHFGGDPAVVGRTIRLNGVPHEVVGIMPDGFLFPYRDHFWVPLRWNPLDYDWGQGPSVLVFGRLADGVSVRGADAELGAIGRRVAAEHPSTHRMLRAAVVPFGGESILRSPSFWSQQYLALLLLTVACGNVGILVLARTATRSGEIAVRAAVGASRARIVTQLFIEALLLGLLGAGVGLGLIEVAARRVKVLLDLRDAPFWYRFDVTWQTALAALALAGFSAAIAGVVPALNATGRNLRRSLQRVSAGASGIRFGGLSSLLIVAEVALGTAFLAVGFRVLPGALRNPGEGLGIVPGEYLTATVSLPWGILEAEEGLASHKTGLREWRTTRGELARRLAAEPGVRGVTTTNSAPGEGYPTVAVELEGGDNGLHRVRYATVDVNYFRTLDQVVLQGRDFGPADVAPDSGEALDAVIVNTTFVKHVLGGGNALGRRFRVVGGGDTEPGPWREIVGVVGHLGMNVESPLLDAGFYKPLPSGDNGRLLIHVAGSHPERLVADVRRVAAEIDPKAKVDDPSRLDDYLRNNPKRITSFWTAVVDAMIAGVAILLSAAGLYALVSFTVSQRRREIGIRTALGARVRSIVATIARRAVLQLVVGVLVGLGVRLVLVEMSGFTSDPNGETPSQTSLLALTIATTLAIGLGACIPPLVRGLRIRPVEALREID
jgi:putative ABC transport system permease protein